MNIGELTMKRKYIMNNVDNLNDKQITELIEIININDINCMKNNNGIFIFLKDIDDTVLNSIYEHIDFCLKQKTNDDNPEEYKINFLDEFIEKKNNNLSRNKKNKFKEINSIKLINYKKKYDLIWIDGAHGYPVVCMDILNSIKLISEGGYILCDDIYINNITSDKMYRSNAGYETLNELKKRRYN